MRPLLEYLIIWQTAVWPFYGNDKSGASFFIWAITRNNVQLSSASFVIIPNISSCPIEKSPASSSTYWLIQCLMPEAAYSRAIPFMLDSTASLRWKDVILGHLKWHLISILIRDRDHVCRPGFIGWNWSDICSKRAITISMGLSVDVATRTKNR
jgi:hypothetical protein